MSEGARPLSEGDRKARRIRTIPALLVGVVVAAIGWGLMTGALAMVSAIRADDGDAAPAIPEPVISGQRGEAPPPPPSPELSDCRQAHARTAGQLRVAARALDMWAAHIWAMNKLVVGAVTLHQASAGWEHSRAEVARNVSRYYAASHGDPFLGTDCPSWEARAQASGALRSCADQVAVERRALSAARVSMRTWADHARDMDRWQAGRMSPGALTRMWLATWQDSLRDLRAYRVATQAANQLGDC